MNDLVPYCSKYVAIHLSDLTTPKDGRVVMTNRYWAVNDEDCALIYVKQGAFSPQCNGNESITKRLLPEGCRCVFVPFAFVPRMNYNE